MKNILLTTTGIVGGHCGLLLRRIDGIAFDAADLYAH